MGGPRYEQTPASAGRLFALSHDLMGALDLEGRLAWTNPAWEHLLADRQVQEATDLGLGVHLARALLEAPDQRHGLQPLPRGAGVGKVSHVPEASARG